MATPPLPPRPQVNIHGQPMQMGLLSEEESSELSDISDVSAAELKIGRENVKNYKTQYDAEIEAGRRQVELNKRRAEAKQNLTKDSE